MKLSLRLRYTDRKSLTELVTTAESVGLHGVWISEPWGYDSSALLGWCAAHTEKLTLGCHVASIFSRSPATTAGMAALLWSLSEGRFRLGLGVSGPAVVEGWHGLPFDHPVKRTRDTVNIIRRVLTGDAVSYEGEMLDAARAAVTPDYIDSIGLFGSRTEIAKRLCRYERAGVDEVVLELRKKDLADQIDDLKDLGKVATS